MMKMIVYDLSVFPLFICIAKIGLRHCLTTDERKTIVHALATSYGNALLFGMHVTRVRMSHYKCIRTVRDQNVL